MSSENKKPKTPAKTEMEIKLEATRNDKILELALSIGINSVKNIDFLNSFINKMCRTLEFENVQRHIEAIEFITSNKPKDTAETFQLFHMFLLNEMTARMYKFASNCETHATIQEYSRLMMKSTSYYSNGMIALKTYRSGVNITKNIQNNTLNQQNNFDTPKPPLENKGKSTPNMEEINKNTKTHQTLKPAAK
jgi:hypothetical protein